MLLEKGLLCKCFPFQFTFITEEETLSNTNIGFARSSRTIAPNQHPLSLKRSWTVAWMEMESAVLALERARVEKSDLLESASWYF